MQKKTSLLMGLLALGLVAAVVLLRPVGGPVGQSASAAGLNSSFTTPYNISNSGNPGNGENASQRVRAKFASDNYLHVAWMEGTLNTANGPAYVRGQYGSWPQWGWAGPNNNPGYTNPNLVVDSSGTVHMVWTARVGSYYEAVYAYKPSGGAWSSYQVLSQGGAQSFYPVIAIDSQDKLWVVWERQITEQDFDIYVRSKPAGGSWGSTVRVSNQGAQDLEPNIAVDADDVPHVVWRNNSSAPNWEIHYTKYASGSWTSPMNLSANSSASHFPRIAADNLGNVYVVWEDEIDGSDRFQTLFRRWNGSSWGANTRVSSTPTKALYPSVSADGCNVYVVWTDYRNTSTEAYFSHSTNCGDTWLGDENVSSNSSSSFYPDVAAQAGGYAHIFWQDYAPGQFDVYYSRGTVQLPAPPTTPPTVTPTFSPSPTFTPTPTPTSTPTPTPTPTPDPRPYGWVDIFAHKPYLDNDYTRLLEVGLQFSATSEIGNPVVDMRYANQADFSDNPDWVGFSPLLYNWTLLETPYRCSWEYVYSQFRDDHGNQSQIYVDVINYDSFVTASMALNGGNAFVNSELVMVNSEDLDSMAEDYSCSGLDDMSLWEEGLTHTVWISYYPELYFFLAPRDPLTGTATVYARYRDKAGNVGVFSDSIGFDLFPPYSGTTPTLNMGVPTTTQLLIPVSGLQAYDDDSGVANAWFANRLQGPWMTMPYEDPPHEYTWNLAYGGPPTQSPDLHSVYIRYEDGAGYGSRPGNLSEVYSSSILVSNISNIYLPIVLKEYRPLSTAVEPPDSGQVELLLLAEPLPAAPEQEMLLWLAARRADSAPLLGDLRLTLPSGLQVVRAWSAYGELLRQDDHLVVSRERASSALMPWILVHARVDQGAAAGLLQVRGEMAWVDGTVEAVPLQVGTR